MAFDQKEVHAQEFTDIERQTLRVWFDVDQSGNDVLADSVLNAGLQFEHYTSLLADEPGQRSQAELAKQQLLAFRLSEQLSQAAAFLTTNGTHKTQTQVHNFYVEAMKHYATLSRKTGIVSYDNASVEGDIQRYLDQLENAENGVDTLPANQ